MARDWFPNGDKLTVRGKIEFYQQTEYDVTNVEVDLQGLIRNSDYHIHMVLLFFIYKPRKKFNQSF